jgi:hypothetical protein
VRSSLIGAALAIGMTGCAFFTSHPKVGPDLGTLTKCVADELSEDALKGDTLLTIGFDVGVVCGPYALQTVEDALRVPSAQRVGSRGSFVLAMRRTNIR